MSRWNQVAEQGQSIWLDFTQRSFVLSGEFKRLIDQDAVTGATANPTIFEQAIASGDYDEPIRRMLEEGADRNQIYEQIAIEDMQVSCDVLGPIWDVTGGLDGYQSLEVSPALARDTEGTIAEACRFFDWIDRPNVLIKIPATAEGLPAIRHSIGHGININITLIFARSRYREVTEAYISGLEDLAASGEKPLASVASVASFFVSRVDTLVDKRLDAMSEKSTDQAKKDEIAALRGKAGIANARLAYKDFLEIFWSDRFQRLAEDGAQLQRPLWASTGVKDPAYKDTMYVEELIGPNTVNTVPPATLDAFRDHGVVRGSTIDDDFAGAADVERRLIALGVDLEEVGRTLEVEGVAKFDTSFSNLLDAIAKKREMISA